MPAIFGTITARKRNRKIRTVIHSLGLVIPFQPCMQKESEILALMNFATESVKTELADRYRNDYTTNILARLEKIFCKLNFNSHRKSLAIMLTPGEEKVIYLDFPVKPVVFFSSSVSLLDLVSNIQREPDFYLFVLNDGSARLYEYYNKHLSKVYAQNYETNADQFYQNASGVIELLNGKNEKPVFISGNPQLVKTFYAKASFAEIMFKKLCQATFVTDEAIQLLATEISHQWSHWESKFIAGQILLAQKAGSLISNIEAVLYALGKKADGLLMMDKGLKKQLYESGGNHSLINIGEELIVQIEKFLTRGNRIEITEAGLLKNFGSIVLLRNISPSSSEKLLLGRRFSVSGTDNF